MVEWVIEHKGEPYAAISFENKKSKIKITGEKDFFNLVSAFSSGVPYYKYDPRENTVVLCYPVGDVLDIDLWIDSWVQEKARAGEKMILHTTGVDWGSVLHGVTFNEEAKK